MCDPKILCVFACLAATTAFPADAEPPLSFTEVTASAGFAYEHGIRDLSEDAPEDAEKVKVIAGGVAAGDYDGDSWVDLYAVRGDIGPNLLFRNRGDGTFEEVGAAAGVAVDGEIGAGPVFGDVDGDGRLDLLIGGVGTTRPRLFRNLGDGTFAETAAPDTHRDTLSAAWGDYDRDGDLDMARATWEHFRLAPCTAPCNGHLWRNDGGVLVEADATAGITGYETVDHTFTPNFTDLDGDGWPELIYASDWQTSRVFRNLGDGTFSDVTDRAVMTDQFGMGVALGDYDNDGDLDWFVTSIHDPGEPDPDTPPRWSGNRLYKNRGDGTFDEVSEAAGVRRGYWGWSACFADFDNDRHLDLFHVNGWFRNERDGDVWLADPSPLFLSNGDGTFTERAAELGLDDTGLGRGVVCFDYDRDGDLDLFVANHSGPPALYRNDGGNARGFLSFRLRGGGNVHAVGATIRVRAGGVTQMREVRMGSNFQSQQPLEVHFGLGDATEAVVEVRWPDGTRESFGRLPANRFYELVPGPGTVFADGFERGDLTAWSKP